MAIDEFLTIATEQSTGIEKHFLADDTEYRSVANSIKNTEQTAVFIVITSIVLGIGTLAALSLHTLIKRKFEIGLLMSMGETNFAILMQFMAEFLFVIMFSLIAEFIVAASSMEAVSNFLNLDNALSIHFGSVLKLTISSLCTLTAITCISSYKVLTCHPQKLL